MNAKIEGLELDKLNPREFGGVCSRATAVLQRAEGKSLDDGVDTIATTDAPAIVVDWSRWEMIREILPMRYCEKPVNDKAVLLDAHSRWSIEDAKGSAKNWTTTEHELLCKCFISKAEPEVRQKIEDGTIDSVSIGYQTDRNQTIEIPKGKSVKVDGVEYKNEFEDDMPMVVRLWWKVKELSLVPIGADAAAKLKRAMTDGIKADDPELQKMLNTIIAGQKSLEEQITINQTKGGLPMAETTKTQEQLRLEAIAEIKTAAINYGESGKAFADKTIDELLQGKEVTESTLKDFFRSATDLLIKEGGAANNPISHVGMNGTELKDYSPTKAIQALISGKRSGLEYEISETIRKTTGLELGEKEFFVPADYQNVGLRHLAKGERSHSVGTPSAGGYFITPDFRPDLLKDVVRNETVLGRLGATVITGLRGQFQMPKIVSGLTHYNVAENTAASKSYIVVGMPTVDAKRSSGYTELGRQLLMAVDPALGGFDTILMNELYKSANVKNDYDGINGDGLSNNPTGILHQSGPSPASLATLNFKNLVNMKRLVAKANGLKENMKFAMSVDVECSLEVTPKEAGQPYGYLLDANGKVIGYNYESSNQIPDAANIFGNWSEFFMLYWGVEKLSIADQPQHAADVIEISLHRYFNTFLRSSESFAISDDVNIDLFATE